MKKTVYLSICIALVLSQGIHAEKPYKLPQLNVVGESLEDVKQIPGAAALITTEKPSHLQQTKS